MSYKNDSLLVIANKYGKANIEAKAELFETYDKLRDLTVNGPSLDGASLGPISNFMLQLAQLVAPGSFMPVLGNSTMINIPGTSYSSSVSGGNGIVGAGQSAFGLSSLGNYGGMPTGGASSVYYGIGNTLTSLDDNYVVGSDSLEGEATGGASYVSSSLAPVAGAVSGIATAASAKGSVVLPVAGFLAGVGSIASSLGPYFGPFGLAASISGKLLNGYAGSVLNSYQTVSSRVINNADTILEEKIRNIETVCKQLDTQSDVVRKMLKDYVEADSKVLQNLLGS
jgi:hypothetical protein